MFIKYRTIILFLIRKFLHRSTIKFANKKRSAASFLVFVAYRKYIHMYIMSQCCGLNYFNMDNGKSLEISKLVLILFSIMV